MDLKLRCNLENVPQNQDACHILFLPPEIIEKIISFFTFKEVTGLRTVCRAFYDVCVYVLKKEMSRVAAKIEHQLEKTQGDMLASSSLDKQFDLCLRYDVLQVLRCELNVMRAICWRYVRSNVCGFFAGEILDEFNMILGCSERESMRRWCYLVKDTDKLFSLVAKFMDHVELAVEPNMEDAVTPFGVKVVDILICCLNSKYDLTLTYNDLCYCLRGSFEVTDINAFISPPEYEEEVVEANFQNLSALGRYLRNLIRLNNMFHPLRYPWETEAETIDVLERKEIGDFISLGGLNVDISASGCGIQKLRIQRKFLSNDGKGLNLKCDVQLWSSNKIAPLSLEKRLPTLQDKRPSNKSFDDDRLAQSVSGTEETASEFSNAPPDGSTLETVSSYKFNMKLIVQDIPTVPEPFLLRETTFTVVQSPTESQVIVDSREPTEIN